LRSKSFSLRTNPYSVYRASSLHGRNSIESLKAGLPTAQFLHRSIFTTGTIILKKKQISHLRAFRMCIVKDSPESALFNHPGALTKLALWIGEALAEQEKEATGRLAHGGRGTPLVVASLDEKRGVYIVVGTGGGGGGPDGVFVDREAAKKRKAEREAKAKAKEESRRAREKVREEKKAARRAARGDGEDGEDEEDDDDESDSDGSDDASESEDDVDDDARKEKGYGLNKFGVAFQDVVAETNARVRIDSFEHCVVEVKKEDLGGFLESLSMKAVVG
jgi:cell division control protein 45